MEGKKISIVVPCHNSGAYLKRCMASLIGQTMPIEELELIFVDDASTDGGETVAILRAMENVYPQSILVICLDQNMRQGGARNVGIQYATGEYLMFVDSDDWIALDACETAYRLGADSGADIVQFGHYTCDYDGEVKLTGRVHFEPEVLRVQSREQRYQLLFEKGCTTACWGKLYRRTMVADAGVKFAEHVIYEEPPFVYPLFYFCKTYAFCDREFYYYCRNEGGTSLGFMTEKQSLWNHTNVQQQVFDFMRQTPFYDTCYQMIDRYYLFGMIVMTFSFAQSNGFSIETEEYERLRQQVLSHLDLSLPREQIMEHPFLGGLLQILQRPVCTQKELDGLVLRVAAGEIPAAGE